MSDLAAAREAFLDSIPADQRMNPNLIHFKRVGWGRYEFYDHAVYKVDGYWVHETPWGGVDQRHTNRKKWLTINAARNAIAAANFTLHLRDEA